MKLSVVVPAFNEGESVRTARAAIAEVFRSQLPGMDFEILFVDDGSRDDTFQHLAALAAEFPYVRVIKFAQNYGSHMAIRAGFDYATGDAACFVACDLQDPPDAIPRMLAALQAPVEIVWAVRNTRQDALSSRLFSRLFYGLARRLVSKNLAPSGSSMFLLGPQALKILRQHQERNLMLDGALATMAVAQAHVPYERQARRVGESKWTLAKKLKTFADFFVGYSQAPIRAMAFLGMVVAVAGVIYAGVTLVRRIWYAHAIEGWSWVMMAVLLLAGMIMVMLGILGEYLWRALDEARSRPRYVVETILNPAPVPADVRLSTAGAAPQ
ncbi:MAG TPA: glycosyltransferase family 2 protein [Terriglobales bacterium]|jgi:dolichol-phosphate mannosyltransferase|nr:glycosyltransferase family 2 protein [Terriglobales bacterium]